MKRFLSLIMVCILLIGITRINGVYASSEEKGEIDVSEVTSGQALNIKSSEADEPDKKTENSESEKFKNEQSESENIDIELSNYYEDEGYTAYAVEGGNIYFDPSAQSIVGFDRTVTKAIIPREIDGIEVKSISKDKLLINKLEEIEIPDSVTSIGDYAFAGCRNLKELNIPDSVTSISGYSIFYECYSLNNMTISAHLLNDSSVFSDSSLKSLSIINISSSSDENISFYKLRDLKNLKEINIDTNNKNYTCIGGAVYNKDKTELIYCPKGIEILEIPSSVEDIDFDLFMGNYNLKEISIDTNNKNYTSINGIVYNKNKTKLIYCPKGINGKVEIPNGVTSIEEDAFYNCYNIEGLEIPKGITEIGEFDGCGSLKTIKIPDSVIEINLCAFDECGSLTEFIVDSKNPNYSSYNGILYNKDKTELIKCGIGVKNVEIIDDVNSIKDMAFAYCNNLKSIVIPKNVTNIFSSEDGGAFYECNNLVDIYVDEDNPNYSSYKGILYNKNKTKLIYCSKGIKNVIIPSSVTEFCYVDFLKNSSSNFYVKKGSYADLLLSGKNCNIVYIDPDETTETSESIKYAAVGGNIYIDTSTGFITSCDKTVTRAVVPDSINGIEVKGIGDFAFYNCDKLSSVKISNNITSIGNFAFYNCKEIVTVDISDNITSIGEFAFANCSKLRYIEIPAGVVNIGEFAFRNCDRLSNISVSAKNMNYSSYQGTLYNKDKTELICCGAGMEELQIPNGVTEITDSAFWNCFDLASVEIPDSVTNIAENAFGECNKENLTLYVKEGTYAEEYAVDNDFNYSYGEYEKIFTYGDIDYDKCITVNDAAILLGKVLDNNKEVPIEQRTNEFKKYADVDNDGVLTAKDAAIILKKALDSEFEMPVDNFIK